MPEFKNAAQRAAITFSKIRTAEDVGTKEADRHLVLEATPDYQASIAVRDPITNQVVGWLNCGDVATAYAYFVDYCRKAGIP